jgi:hypothetical protein
MHVRSKLMCNRLTSLSLKDKEQDWLSGLIVPRKSAGKSPNGGQPSTERMDLTNTLRPTRRPQWWAC